MISPDDAASSPTPLDNGAILSIRAAGGGGDLEKAPVRLSGEPRSIVSEGDASTPKRQWIKNVSLFHEPDCYRRSYAVDEAKGSKLSATSRSARSRSTSSTRFMDSDNRSMISA